VLSYLSIYLSIYIIYLSVLFPARSKTYTSCAVNHAQGQGQGRTQFCKCTKTNYSQFTYSLFFLKPILRTTNVYLKLYSTCLQYIQSFQPDDSDRTVSSGTPDTFICSCFEPESESDLDLDLTWSSDTLDTLSFLHKENPRFCLSTSSEDEEDPGHSGPAVDEVFQDQQKD